MSWALPAGRIFGISIRVHFILLVYVLIQVLKPLIGASSKSQDSTPLGLNPSLILLGSLIFIVLLHELGHCFACRRVGGVADEVLLWPLGGLAYCEPPHDWKSHLITVIGGPAVNVVIFLILAPILGILSGVWFGFAIPNPFTLNGLVQVALLDVSIQNLGMVLFLAHWVNLVLLLFNLCLPMYPFDGGRILQAILWRRIGYSRSMRIAVRAGYIGAILLAATAFVCNEMLLLVVAIFGAITCWTTQRQLQFTDEFLGIGDDEPDVPVRVDSRLQEELQETEHAAEVDRILQKIADVGIDRLTRAERRVLKQETERKRKSEL